MRAPLNLVGAAQNGAAKRNMSGAIRWGRLKSAKNLLARQLIRGESVARGERR